MSVTSAQLRALTALGITGDQLLAVVDVMEMRDADRDGPLTPAERSKNYRARKRDAERDEPSRDASVTKTPLTFLETPKVEKEKEEKKKEAVSRNRGCVCPDSWQPNEAHHREATATYHRARDDVVRLGEEMRNWSKSNANRAVARKSDWDLTFTGWMRRTWSKTNGQRTHHAPRQSGGADFFRGLAEVAADIDRDSDLAGPADPGIPRGRHEFDA